MLSNSRDVAAFFGMDHKHVLRDIEHIQAESPNLDSLWFASSTYEAGEGFRRRSYPCADMARDGFTILVMGYTGADAMRLRPFLSLTPGPPLLAGRLRKMPSAAAWLL